MIARTGFFVLVTSMQFTGIIIEASEDGFRCEPQEKPKDKYFKTVNSWRVYFYAVRHPEYIAEHIQFQDHSHAGVWEFPYLVDVRTLDTESYEQTEDWFNANLVTSRFALTTCDAIATFERADELNIYYKYDSDKPNMNDKSAYISYSWKHYGQLFKNFVLVKKDPKKYKILYASAYNYIPTKGREDEVGTRLIKAFLPHPSCAYFNVDMSFGIIAIMDPIYPSPPHTSYLHLDFNCTWYQSLKMQYDTTSPPRTSENNLDYHFFEDASCTIGMWGRYIARDGVPLPLNDNTTVVNFKLRYRVRPVDPNECMKIIYMFPPRFHTQSKDFVECMALSVNESMGVICDHDKGAPIVCGHGKQAAVRAFMLAGVLPRYCNNSKPHVFMVVDARMIFPLYAHINSLAVYNVTQPGHNVRGEGLRLYFPNTTHLYFFTFFFIYYSFI